MTPSQYNIVFVTNLTSMGFMQGKRTPCTSPIATLTMTSDHALQSEAGTDTMDRIPDSAVEVSRTNFVPKISESRPPRTAM